MHPNISSPHRHQVPPTPPLPTLGWTPVEHHSIGPKLPISIVRNHDYPLVSLSIVMDAGVWQTTMPGVAYLTAELLPKTHSDMHDSVIEAMAYYGAQLDCIATADRLLVELSVASEHFYEVFPVFAAMLRAPTFAPKDLEILKSIVHQKLKHIAAYPKKRAEKIIQKQLFSRNHPYGYLLDHQRLAAISLAQLRQHYADHAWRNGHIYLSGKVTEGMIDALQQAWSDIEPKAATHVIRTKHPHPKKHTTVRQPCAQAIIRMAQPTIAPNHPDYQALYSTNKLLGGFFGSRLMTTIREEKGYTYGIHSYLQPLRHQTMWHLATSVKKEHVFDAQEAIVNEIKRLQTLPIQPQELRMLQNYLTGELLSRFDDPFSIIDRLKAVHLHQQTLDYYTSLQHTIQHLTPQVIQTMAQTYFTPNDLHTVIITQ